MSGLVVLLQLNPGICWGVCTQKPEMNLLQGNGIGRFVVNPRTNFNRNFIRGFDAKFRAFNAIVLQ
jgi:hypothetical protein